MADEAPRTDPAAETPQVVAPAESAVNGHNSDGPQKDVTMSDAPVDHPAVCSLCSICSRRGFFCPDAAHYAGSPLFDNQPLVSGAIWRTDY